MTYARQPRPIAQNFAPPPKREKRYGWCRLYNDFTGHPKWRVTAEKIKRALPAGIFTVTRDEIAADYSLAVIHAVVVALFNGASKARDRGALTNIDFDEIAAALNLPAVIVATAYRTLGELGWIEDDHIVDWPDRQPDHEDPTANERQRNRRARKKAKRALAMGVELPPEQRALASRATGSERAPPPQVVRELRLADPANRTPEGIAAAEAENERIARDWLLGSGVNDFGTASAIVAAQFRQLRTSAHETVIRWLNEIDRDCVALALIIDAAEQSALTADAFEAMVRQRIAAVITERDKGPSLPLAPTALRGGRRG